MSRVVIPAIATALRGRRLWKFFGVCATGTLLFAPIVAADRKGIGSFEITVDSRTGFFNSPGYNLKISDSGRITYRGYANVHAMGKRHGKISHAAVEQLVIDIRRSGFLDLPSAYDNAPCLTLDNSEGGVRVRLDGREKSTGTCGAPWAVSQLMEEVDSLAQVWRWVVYDARELRSDIAHGWKVSDHMPVLMQDAITWDADEIIRVLASNGADVNGFDDSSEHFLMRAVSLGRVKATRALLDLGADWRAESSELENSIAVEAAWREPAIVELFLEKGANPNFVTGAGHTMLMSAASMANLEDVKLLVESGADVNVRNTRGENALSVARQRQRDYRATPANAQSFQPVIDYLLAHSSVP
jgi:uncharacterized protein DUF6438/ankyrin repeat protein